jgi:hypothetical protein
MSVNKYLLLTKSALSLKIKGLMMSFDETFQVHYLLILYSYRQHVHVEPTCILAAGLNGTIQ